ARGVSRVLAGVAARTVKRAPFRCGAVGAARGRAVADASPEGVGRPERAVRVTASPPVSPTRDASWAGHPRGLSTLFFTEMWERFSYYGMRGFLILYMVKALGFNDQHAGAVYGNYVGSVWLAAIFGGIIAGKLAEGVDWHIGFACAGVGMTLGLVQYVVGRRRLQPAMERLAARPKPAAAATGASPGGFTAEDWRRMAAVVVFFAFASLFWGAYEQAGSTLNLFADRYVHLELLGIRLYASWLLSIHAAFLILLSPAVAWLWVKLGPRQPSSPAKFA